jgi:Ca2+-binding RTX toxin-like protein
VNIDLGNGASVAIGFDLSGGPFAPGKTPEAATSEIEFTITNPGAHPTLDVLGTSGDDGYSFGQRRNPVTFVNELLANLNADQEETSPDVDVSSSGRFDVIEVRTYEGSDLVSMRGTRTIQSAAFAGSTNVGDGPGDDEVAGGDGTDVFFVNDDPDPNDVFRGGPGVDQLYYDQRLEEVSVSLNGRADDGHMCPGPGCEGDDVGRDIEYFRLGGESDRFVGARGRQTVDAGSGNDVMFGGPGSDVFFGGPGADIFQGGKGFDAVAYGGPDPVTVRLNGQADDGSVGEMDDVEPDVEMVVGGSGNDHLRGSGGPNVLVGGLGNDLLEGRGGDDAFELQRKGLPFALPEGDDLYVGGPGVDTVALDLLQGDVRVSLDDVKNDRVIGDPTKGVKNVHSDIENVVTGAGDDQIIGSAKPNRLVSGEGKDTLLGGGGADLLVPGPGGDAARGGPGTDTISFAGATHGVTANLARGSASGDGPDVLATAERLIGTSLGDRLTGNAGPNVLTGGLGADQLMGLDGDDRLVGGPGDDSLAGGQGIDTCRQGPGSGPTSGCER